MKYQELEIYKPRRPYPTKYPSFNKTTLDVRPINAILNKADSKGIKIVMNMKSYNERSPEYSLIYKMDNKPVTGTIHTRCDEVIAELEEILCVI